MTKNGKQYKPDTRPTLIADKSKVKSDDLKRKGLVLASKQHG